MVRPIRIAIYVLTDVLITSKVVLIVVRLIPGCEAILFEDVNCGSLPWIISSPRSSTGFVFFADLNCLSRHKLDSTFGTGLKILWTKIPILLCQREVHCKFRRKLSVQGPLMSDSLGWFKV